MMWGPPLRGRWLFQFPTSLLESSRQIVQYFDANLFFDCGGFRAGTSEEEAARIRN